MPYINLETGPYWSCFCKNRKIYVQIVFMQLAGEDFWELFLKIFDGAQHKKSAGVSENRKFGQRREKISVDRNEPMSDWIQPVAILFET